MSDRVQKRVSRRALVLAAIAALALAVAVMAAGHGGTRSRGALAWLRPAPAPPRWRVARTPAGATLPYPPGWRRVHADVGEVSAAPAGPGGQFVGYLNATPRQGAETLSNWHRFRVDHNADEGSRRVQLEASASGLRLGGGRGSCVIDSYTTSRDRFREVACIVAGRHTTAVVVGAAPVRLWAREAPTLDAAVASFAVS